MKYAGFCDLDKKGRIAMEILDTELIEKILKNDRPTHSDVECKNCSQPMGKFPSQTPVGMCYVPMEEWREIYDNEKGLERGTIFKELDKPFTGERGVLFD